MPLPGLFQGETNEMLQKLHSYLPWSHSHRILLFLWSNFIMIIIICPRVWTWHWPTPRDGDSRNNRPSSARKLLTQKAALILADMLVTIHMKQLVLSFWGELQLLNIWLDAHYDSDIQDTGLKTWIIWDWFQGETVYDSLSLFRVKESIKENRNWTFGKIHSAKILGFRSILSRLWIMKARFTKVDSQRIDSNRVGFVFFFNNLLTYAQAREKFSMLLLVGDNDQKLYGII